MTISHELATALLSGATALLGAAAGYIVRMREAANSRLTAQADADARRYAAALDGYKTLCEDLQERIDHVTARLHEAEERIAKLERENASLAAEIVLLRARKSRTRPEDLPKREE